MDDSKIRPFTPRPSRDLKALLDQQIETRVPAEARQQKLGLYPLAEDVVVSLPLFHLIVTVLVEGNEDQRKQVATLLRDGFQAPFQPL